MEVLVDSRQMKLCDKNTIECFKVPSLVLMERAALCMTEEIDRHLSLLKQYDERTALIVCGCGNNGGDGLAVGRMLWQKGYDVTIVMPPGERNVSEETQAQIDILNCYGIEIVNDIPDSSCDVVVDALFGIGLTRELEGVYLDYVIQMNQKKGLKVAMDIPSGIHADTGEVMGAAFSADVTVTFAFLKPGLLLYPGAGYAGEILVREIGIDAHSFLEEKPFLYSAEQADLKKIPARKSCSHKGTFGRVLTAAGHKNMAGAAFFSAKAAYKTGAGLVRILTEEANRVVLQQLLPEAVLSTYEKETLKEQLSEDIKWASVIVAGPGLGTGEQAEVMVKTILEQAEVPVILDADGLNITANHLEWLKEAKAPVIVTPHMGEMERLTGKCISDMKGSILQTAGEFARAYHVICVLKDARTVTALPDGRVYINRSGNSGLAAGGSGDVLTGILAGLIAQGMESTQAAPLGVYLHGLSADKKVPEVGTYGMTAQDVIEGIAQVLKENAPLESVKYSGLATFADGIVNEKKREQGR
ncbi:MAG: NAD(P)H-hydrate dehydratase [Lachnospiraceae bacterium]|nr:NAD(P)H-hydrate dehydratase [Lachnospiraceae bacterium]